jgi:D-3-phosphoglycerate dehydrogenase
MTTRVKTFDKIAPQGLSLFGPAYTVSVDEAQPELILARSTKVDTDAFSSLIAVARAGAGVNTITVPAATAKGIPVFNTPGANAQAVAELVFTVVGGFMRNLPHAYTFMRAMQASDDETIEKLIEAEKSAFKGSELKGKMLGVIGLGKIGVLVANGGIARGMHVVGYDPQPTPSNMHALETRVEVVNSPEEVVAKADIVSIHVPLFDATRGLVGEKLLSLARPGAIVVNYSRREICDEAAILAALDSKKLRGFLTDFPSIKLLGRDDVFCTPHLGASTAESEDTCAVMAVQQLKRYAEEGLITNAVNFPSLIMNRRPETTARITVVNADVPNMIAAIASVFGAAGVNINAMANESNGTVGYNIIDVSTPVPETVLSALSALNGVIRTRVISFT